MHTHRFMYEDSGEIEVITSSATFFFPFGLEKKHRGKHGQALSIWLNFLLFTLLAYMTILKSYVGQE